MKKILLSTVFAGLLVLSACASQPGASGSVSNSNALQQIAAFTVSDLQAADADAVAHNDAIAHACYPALIKFVQSSPLNTPTTTVKGAFSAFQMARDTKNTLTTLQVPDYLKLGCAALLVDVNTFVAQLAAIGGGAAVGVPILGAVIH